MFLADDDLAIYIAAGLAGFLVLVWCLAMMCKGPCRSFEEPVKSPFDMYMDPATRNEALQNKYEVYHYHLMTPRTPVERHQIKVPTPLNEAGATTPSAFDFGAVLRMHSLDKENSQKNGRQTNDPLLMKQREEQGSSSTDLNDGKNRKVNRITVDIESNKEEGTSVPLIMDSTV